MASRSITLSWVDALLNLFYPNLCYACSRNLPSGSDPICLTCQYKLPRTDHHHHTEDNAFTQRLWGRVELQAAAAFLHFVKDGRVQQLLHQLKYSGQSRVGVYLGKIYGQTLRESGAFSTIDGIVPVPLHPKKEKVRGYNQAAKFAQGLSEALQRPCRYPLRRAVFTPTQPRMTRAERLRNVGRAFALPDPKMIEGQHLLLVDDVITTGATLEACANTLLKAPGVRLSMAAIAIAD